MVVSSSSVRMSSNRLKYSNELTAGQRFQQIILPFQERQIISICNSQTSSLICFLDEKCHDLLKYGPIIVPIAAHMWRVGVSR